MPCTLPDVLDRVFQSQCTSRLALDAEFFDRLPRRCPDPKRATQRDAQLRAFGERDDIMFAYPTQRFFDNSREGKAGVRPDALAEERET